MQTIKFPRLTAYWGRNGHAKCAGIDLFESGLPSQSIGIIPINSKNQQGSAEIYLPKESISEIINALSEYAPKPEMPTAPLPEPVEGKPEPIHFLFGDDACRIYSEDGIEALTEYIESGEAYELYEYTGDAIDLISNFSGWDDYIILSKDEYNKISEL